MIEASVAGGALEELERTFFGSTRIELIRLIHASLGLPDAVLRPIDAMLSSSATASPLLSALHMADTYANGLMLATGPSAQVRSFTKAQNRSAGLGDDPVVPDGATFRSEIVALTSSLAGLSAREQEQAIEPLFPKRSTRVWLAREPAMSAFDPISAALSSLAEVTVENRLPGDAELASHEGLAIVCRTDAAPGFSRREVERLIASRPLPVLHWSSRSRRSDAPDEDPLRLLAHCPQTTCELQRILQSGSLSAETFWAVSYRGSPSAVGAAIQYVCPATR